MSMNPWNLRKSRLRIPSLGERVKEFLTDYTEWVLYLRKDDRFVCTNCYSPSHESASHETVSLACPDCWGTGKRITPQIIGCRLYPGAGALRPRFLGGGVVLELGQIENVTIVGIFARNAYPQQGDILLTCEWNKDSRDFKSPPKPRPMRILDSYIVKQHVYRYDSQVGWFAVGLDNHNFNNDLFDRILPTVSDFPIIAPGF